MKPITGQTVWGAATSGTTTQLDNNFALVINAINDFATYANFLVDSGAVNSYVVTLPANATGTLVDGFLLQMRAINANTGASTLAYNGGSALNILNIDGSVLAAGAIPANSIVALQYRASDTVWLLQSSGIASTTFSVPVRQTLLAGPMDANGASTLLPKTSANLTVTTANITANAPLTVTVANGFSITGGGIDRIGGVTSNLSWANLTANSINYLGVTIAANGSLSTVFTANAPVYQSAGTPSVANGNYTFNIQPMTMSAGNGTASAQSWTVFVGEANCNSNAVVSAVSYAYMGRYESPFTATLPNTSTTTTAGHNLGIYPKNADLVIQCTTTDGGYAVGDQLDHASLLTALASAHPMALSRTTNNMSLSLGSTTAFFTVQKTGGGTVTLTLASWKYKFIADRGW